MLQSLQVFSQEEKTKRPDQIRPPIDTRDISHPSVFLGLPVLKAHVYYADKCSFSFHLLNLFLVLKLDKGQESPGYGGGFRKTQK